jgi:hypothetical protein
MLKSKWERHHAAIIKRPKPSAPMCLSPGEMQKMPLKKALHRLTFFLPSKKLVLVRFGATAVKSAWNDDAFAASILAALPY